MTEQKRMQEALNADADDPRIRVRAAVTYVNARGGYNDEALRLEAFMAIFHPEVAEDRQRMLKLRQAMKGERR